MKFSVSTYSFSALNISLSECVGKAKEIGFDAIEIAANVTLEQAGALRAECERAGLAIANYTIAADLLNGVNGGKPADEVTRLKREVDVAAALGAPGMRHDATWGINGNTQGWRGFDDVLPLLADGCRAVAAYAAEKGVRTMVENHGLFAQDSERMEKLVTAVAHENFGILCDMGNFLCVDEEPIMAVGKCAANTFHAHAKDFHFKSGAEPDPGQGFFGTRGGNYLRGAIVGHGIVPVQQCLRILKNAGYNGYISLEFEGMEDPILGITVGLENLRRWV